jgi:hypothetical protein
MNNGYGNKQTKLSANTMAGVKSNNNERRKLVATDALFDPREKKPPASCREIEERAFNPRVEISPERKLLVKKRKL